MLYRLKNPALSPPGGFNVAVAETGYATSKVPDFHSAVKGLRNHLAGMQLPYGEAESMVDHQTAARLARAGHTAWVEAAPEGDHKRHWSDYLRGAAAWISISAARTLGKQTLVSEDEATTRAEICLAGGPNGAPCPNHQPAAEEGLAAAIRRTADAVMHGQVGGQTTPHDAALLSCAACSCPIAAKVHFAGSMLKATTPDNVVRKLPSYCWVKQAVLAVEPLVDPKRSVRSTNGGSCASC